jgi:hypothetical protein
MSWKRMPRYDRTILFALLLTPLLGGCDSPPPIAPPGAPAMASGPGDGGDGGGDQGSVVTEREPNDVCPGAPHDFGSTEGGTGRGWISTPDDVDCWTPRSVRPGKELKAVLQPPPGKDYDVQIVDEGGNVLASNHRGPGEAEEVRARNPSQCCNRQFRLRVFSFDGSSSATESYTLRVDKVH